MVSNFIFQSLKCSKCSKPFAKVLGHQHEEQCLNHIWQCTLCQKELNTKRNVEKHEIRCQKEIVMMMQHTEGVDVNHLRTKLHLQGTSARIDANLSATRHPQMLPMFKDVPPVCVIKYWYYRHCVDYITFTAKRLTMLLRLKPAFSMPII